jgi:hypothetical protein
VAGFWNSRLNALFSRRERPRHYLWYLPPRSLGGMTSIPTPDCSQRLSAILQASLFSVFNLFTPERLPPQSQPEPCLTQFFCSQSLYPPYLDMFSLTASPLPHSVSCLTVSSCLFCPLYLPYASYLMFYFSPTFAPVPLAHANFQPHTMSRSVSSVSEMVPIVFCP